MAMRETEGSLRAYLLIVGVLGTIGGLSLTGEACANPTISGPGTSVVLWFQIVTNLALCVGFVIAGLKLKAMLRTGARRLQQLLLGSILSLVAGALLRTAGAPHLRQLGLQLIGLAITAYLLANVRRLSAEAMARAAVPPARSL